MKKLVDSEGNVKPESLCVVHVTQYRPRRNADEALEIKTTSHATDYKIFRNSVHFSLNHQVQANNGGKWDDKPYVVIGDMQAMVAENGSLAGFNPVDSWWTRDIDETVRVPKGMLIAPGVVQEGLMAHRGHDVIYKAWDFTVGDLKAIHATLPVPSRYPLEDLLEEKPEFKKLLELSVSHDDERIMEHLPSDDKLRNNVALAMRNMSRNLAVHETITALEYPYQKAGMHYWIGQNLKPDTLHETAAMFGSIYTTHRDDPLYNFEKRINSFIVESEKIKPGQAEAVTELEKKIRDYCSDDLGKAEVDEKTKRVGKYVLSKLLVELGCEPLSDVDMAKPRDYRKAEVSPLSF